MAQEITLGVRDLIKTARAQINELSVEEAIELHGRDDVVIVDIRDVRELQREGRVPGSFHAPRGMLEFWVDPNSPYFKEVFAEEKHFVFHCAGGLRSALAAEVVQRMGLKPVSHVIGGFGAWKAAGGPVEEHS